MSTVTFIDSTALSTLVDAHNTASDTDRQLIILPSRIVQRILDVTGLAHLFVTRDR